MFSNTSTSQVYYVRNSHMCAGVVACDNSRHHNTGSPQVYYLRESMLCATILTSEILGRTIVTTTRARLRFLILSQS